MIMVNNPFGQDPMDFNEETAADRIGARIRNIRNAKGMSQGELGEKIGLNADRVQKYENGARKPGPSFPGFHARSIWTRYRFYAQGIGPADGVFHQ